jgi:hypothetical protein
VAHKPKRQFDVERPPIGWRDIDPKLWGQRLPRFMRESSDPHQA